MRHSGGSSGANVRDIGSVGSGTRRALALHRAAVLNVFKIGAVPASGHKGQGPEEHRRSSDSEKVATHCTSCAWCQWCARDSWVGTRRHRAAERIARLVERDIPTCSNEGKSSHSRRARTRTRLQVAQRAGLCSVANGISPRSRDPGIRGKRSDAQYCSLRSSRARAMSCEQPISVQTSCAARARGKRSSRGAWSQGIGSA